MADLNDNLIYLIVTFFCLTVIGIIFMVVIYGTLYPILVSTVTTLNPVGGEVSMDAASQGAVLGGFNQVVFVLKILIPGLFLGCFIAIIMFIFFKKEQEEQVY